MFLNRFSCVILDIEGTTTSIKFVQDQLFPFVKNNVDRFIKNNWQDPVIKLDIEALQKQSELDVNDGVEDVVLIPNLSTSPSPEEIASFHKAITKNVLWQMSLDRKTTSLKCLQGHMWATAYKDNKIHGHVYNDVPQALKLWQDVGLKTYIYSSGSVEAQKLLFRHSDHGDLLKFINGHFDTNVGPKWISKSYKDILATIGVKEDVALFITDSAKEAYAASDAGLNVSLIVREGNEPLTEKESADFFCISSLMDLKF